MYSQCTVHAAWEQARITNLTCTYIMYTTNVLVQYPKKMYTNNVKCPQKMHIEHVHKNCT